MCSALKKQGGFLTKFKYPYPIIFNSDPVELEKYCKSVGMLALTENKELVMVNECYNPSIWRSFWKQVSNISLDKISITKDHQEDFNQISFIGKQITQGLKYIIANNYIFLGILYLDSKVLDSHILEDWGLFSSRKTKRFKNFQQKYHEQSRFPHLYKNSYVKARFIGLGEKFLYFNNLSYKQIAKMSIYFKGSLNGIIGVPEKDESIEFVILSQSITKGKSVSPLKLDKKGRQTLYNWIKMNQFSPAGGFRLDYGFWGLTQLAQWKSINIIPEYVDTIQLYQKYLKEHTQDQDFQIERHKCGPPYDEKIKNLLNNFYLADRDSIPQKKEKSGSSAVKISDKPDPTKLQKVAIPQTKIQKLEKVSIPKTNSSKPQLSKPNISSISKSSEKTETTEDYEDIFAHEKQSSKIQAEGQTILDSNELDSVLDEASFLIDSDLGEAVNPALMDESTVFQDLENSLDALSQLDELAEKNAAEMRLYYPPPTFVSYASKEGMQIGGSTCVLSMGVGRNLWAIPELQRMQMWGEFWNQDEVEGNPQIKDFVSIDNKDITSAEQLEDALQKAFIRIRRNEQVFIGLAEFEGNGFESNIFKECELSESYLRKLMDIHTTRRNEVSFPEIAQDSWIEVRYHGKPEIIRFLSNPDALGSLEIVADVINNPRFKRGILAGIVCLEEEAANIFILSDNFSELKTTDPTFSINEETLTTMFDMINRLNLIPVSWCKFSFGFRGLEGLPQWDDIKDGIIIQIIKEKYTRYLNHRMESKAQEDAIRRKAESDFAFIPDSKPESNLHAIKCPSCGTENPKNVKKCIVCGTMLK